MADRAAVPRPLAAQRRLHRATRAAASGPDAHRAAPGALCAAGLAARFAALPAAREAGSPQWRQWEHELAVIQQLDLDEFFLCAHDIMCQARHSGIRVSGRGSAANSLVAYLLGITGVDPLQHKLLFERFLNPDRRGMPDIDLDVQSDRRDELIRCVEQTYVPEHAAMVANVITYRPHSALRAAAKALGFPLPLVNQLTKVLPHHSVHTQLPSYVGEPRQVVAAAARRVDFRHALRQGTSSG